MDECAGCRERLELIEQRVQAIIDGLRVGLLPHQFYRVETLLRRLDTAAPAAEGEVR